MSSGSFTEGFAGLSARYPSLQYPPNREHPSRILAEKFPCQSLARPFFLLVGSDVQKIKHALGEDDK